MRLTERTDAALRILMYLAVHADQRCSIDVVVEQCNSHRSQVVAAVQILRKAGYIASSAGRNGGIWLDAEPEDITVSEVVQLMENDFQLAQCFASAGNCDCVIKDVCLLRPALKSALGAFFQELQNVTLLDLISNADRLKEVCGPPVDALEGTYSESRPV
ncbi:RrF2 family transcriptional regulator [Roseibium sp. SCP14]|uniref:RrF2 family transcriptional regulator n=1 Tax=Roseibium sp. SCP14 TaxID=3141375 RepID=UPI003336BA9B